MLTIMSYQRDANKITMKYHYILSRMTKIKKRWTKTHVGEDVEKLELLSVACGSVKEYNYFGKQALS